VPWYELPANTRTEIHAEPLRRADDTDEELLEGRLADLGYV